MNIGLFTREGKNLVGRIGPLALAWDRHEGGRLAISRLVAGEPLPVGRFAIHAHLEGGRLCSADDQDPRLIPVEAGPHRLALRAVQRLCDADGIHLGDAMQETWAWADGSIYLNAMLRLIHPERGGALIAAAAELALADGWQPIDGERHLSHERGAHAAVLCYRNGGIWAHPTGVEEPTAADVRRAWEPLTSAGPPFYRTWGPYFEQWGGSPGWSSVQLADGPVVRGVWAEGESRDRGPAEAFNGMLALLTAGDEATLARRERALQNPLTPIVDGGKALYYCPMEGTTVIGKTAEDLKVTLPADPAERQVRLHIRGLRGRPVGNSAKLVWPLSDGGTADDPNGPNLLRPDDRHGPILTDADLPPDELLTTILLAADREVDVELTSAPGIWLAAQRWDERQNLLLFSTAHANGNLGAFCLRDLKMRDLKVPGDPHSVMARLPLYWFTANASTAHQCLNHPKTVDLIENGPDAVGLRVVAENPAGTAESDIEVRIPFAADRLRLDLRCRFTAHERWEPGAIQYCNFFPEEQRYPEAWGSDRVLVMAEDGQWMRIDHRAAGTSRVLAGELFQHYEGNLFVALYGGPRASILTLSCPEQIEGARQEYVLCEAWLDNHLNLSADGGAIAAGTRWAVALSLVLVQTTHIDEDIEALGRRALKSGAL